MPANFAMQFYNSKQWKELRFMLIIQRGAKCERCGKDFMLDPSHLIAHHKKELTPTNIQDPTIALNPENIEIICDECHNKEHRRFGYAHQHEVYIVYGAPCSGKSTFVKQMIRRGDLVVNMDLLYQAISGCVLYDKPDKLKGNVIRVHDVLIDQIKTRYGQWGNAYIEGGYPIKSIREGMAQKLKAELVFCEASMEECLANAERRGIFAKEWQGYIRRWFDSFQP